MSAPEFWAANDLQALLGRQHPLVELLEGTIPQLWPDTILARMLLVLWRRHPDRRPELVEAAIIIGCEEQLLQVYRRVRQLLEAGYA